MTSIHPSPFTPRVSLQSFRVANPWRLCLVRNLFFPPPPAGPPRHARAWSLQGCQYAYVLPTNTSFTWSSVTQGGRVVTVYNTDPAFILGGGTYVIGVYSATDSSFFLTSTISGNSITQLQPGVPQVRLHFHPHPRPVTRPVSPTPTPTPTPTITHTHALSHS